MAIKGGKRAKGGISADATESNLFANLGKNLNSMIADVLSGAEIAEDDFSKRIAKARSKSKLSVDDFADSVSKTVLKVIMEKSKETGKAVTPKSLVKIMNDMHILDDSLQKTMLDLLKNQDEYFKRWATKSQQMAEELMKPFDQITDWMKKLPGGKLLSSMFGFDKIRDDIEDDIIAKFMEFEKTGKVTFTTLTDIGVSAFKAIGGALKSLFAHPMLLALAAIIGALYIAYKQWAKINESAKSLRDETGLTGKAAMKLAEQGADIADRFTGMGVDMEAIGKATAGLVNEFQTTAVITKEMQENASLMVGALGVAPDIAAKTLRIFKNTAGMTDEMSGNLMAATANAAKLGGVAPSVVFKDLAESSKEIYLFFKGNVKEAAKAAVELRRMGTSLKDAAATSKNLLDFESSITSELEASVLAGTQLNFARARYLSYTGDLVGSQNAVLDQVQKIKNFEGMNVIQKEAIAKASGMELDKLENMLVQRKEISKMNYSDKLAYESSLKALDDFRKVNKVTLIQENQRLLATEQMKKGWDNIIFALSKFLQPIFEGLSAALEEVSKQFQDAFSTKTPEETKKTIESIKKDFEAIFSVLIGITKVIIWIAKAIQDVGNFFGVGWVGGLAIFYIAFKLTMKLIKGDLIDALKDFGSKFADIFKGKSKKTIVETGKDILKTDKEKLPGGVDPGKLDKETKPLKSIGDRIKDFFGAFKTIDWSDIAKFAVVLGVLILALIGFAFALKQFNDVKWQSVLYGLGSLVVMAGVAKILANAGDDMIEGALSILILGAAMIPFAFAMKIMEGVTWKTLAIAAVALLGFSVVAIAAGVASEFIIAGAIAIGILGVALYVFGKAMQQFIPIAKPFSEAIVLIINAIGGQVVSIINSVADAICKVGDINAVNLMAVAAGITAVGISLAAFGGGSVLAGIGSFIGNFLGGDPIAKLERLAALAPNLSATAVAIASLGTALTNFKVPDIGNIDELQKIAEASVNIQANKQTNVNVAAPDNSALSKKLDEVINAITSMKIEMDGKKVGEVIATATPQHGRA